MVDVDICIMYRPDLKFCFHEVIILLLFGYSCPASIVVTFDPDELCVSLMALA